MKDTSMKKYMPFKSLSEQDAFLNKMMYEKFKSEKPHISSDKAREINDVLTQYNGTDHLDIWYYFDGYIYKLNAKITLIDTLNKKLIIEDNEILFDNVVDVNNPKTIYFDY